MLDVAAVSAHHRRIDRSSNVFTKSVGLLGALHEGAYDVLFGMHAAEEIDLRFRFGFIMNHRRVAGMRDEIG